MHRACSIYKAGRRDGWHRASSNSDDLVNAAAAVIVSVSLCARVYLQGRAERRREEKRIMAAAAANNTSPAAAVLVLLLLASSPRAALGDDCRSQCNDACMGWAVVCQLSCASACFGQSGRYSSRIVSYVC
jgi:hypothetical protein